MVAATIRIALRNLWRRPQRFLLSWSMICVGTALIVVSMGLAQGIYGDMIDLATRTYSGDFQVVRGDFWEKPHPKRAISGVVGLKERLQQHPEVMALSSRVEVAGMMTTGRRAAGVLVVGVEHDSVEGRVSRLPASLERGTWLEAREAGSSLPILLSSGVAKNLQVDLGDEVHFSSQDAGGRVFIKSFAVVGIVHTGLEDLDASLAFVRLPHAQALLGLGERVHRVVGVLSDREALGQVADTPLSQGSRLLSWEELLPDLKQSIETDYVGMQSVLLLILVLVVLGVMNTISMSVFERQRELGVLLAIGASPGHILWLVLWEGIWLSLLGVVTGTGLGVLANAWAASHGIPLSEAGVEFAGVVIREVHSRNTIEGNIVAPLIIFAAGAVAGLLPAFRAARLDPMQALHPTRAR